MFGVHFFFINDEIHTFIQEGCIKLIICDKDINNVKTYKGFYFKKCCSFKLCIYQRILTKSITVSTKIFKQHNCFNIDIFNNMKTGVMTLKIQLCNTGVNYILKCTVFLNK